MRVRVKETLVENFYGFYGDERRYPGDKFDLVERKTKDGEVVSVESQFSERWMEKVNKPGPKPKEPVKTDPPLT
jgi:hypothetical protein